MIKVEHLTKTYHRKTVVDDLSIRVLPGMAFALLGSNGAGKSTTIKMILKLVRPDRGEIELKAKTRLGYSPETPYFPPFLNGTEVMEYYCNLQKINLSEGKRMIPAILKQVGLEADKTRVKHYSKGMQQRLALAQALIGDPDLLILDEPCAGLDALGRLEMLKVISRLKQDGKTIVMNSHILSDIEKVCDRGVIMKKGRIVEHWTLEELENGKLNGSTLEEVFLQAVEGDHKTGEEAKR